MGGIAQRTSSGVSGMVCLEIRGMLVRGCRAFFAGIARKVWCFNVPVDIWSG